MIVKPPKQDAGTGHREPAPDYDSRATMRAWEDFLTDGHMSKPDVSGVRHQIQDSWSRSASFGIDSGGNEAPLHEDREEIERLRRRNRDLCNAAKDSFSQLGRLLEDTGAMLILTDSDGVIIDTIGDSKTLDAGRRIHLEVGGVWNETAIGTNGIGMALWTGEPVFVHAAEHFCAGIKGWTCAGAPIRDPLDHSIIGVIDLSGPTEIFQRHNTALVAAAAREIHEALEEHQREERARLLEAYLDCAPAMGAEDGVVILDQLGRVIYNRNTGNPVPHPEGVTPIAIGQKLLELSEATSEAEIADALPGNLRPRDINPLMLNGEFRGTALILPGRSRATQSFVPAPCMAPPAIMNDEPMVIVSENEKLLEAIDLARRAAGAGTTILIEGETGVGKELFAHLVHGAAKRSGANPFVAVNCGAISRDLFGGELFGHVAGAFTGAVREGKRGKFELADGGVLCLDEIGEMPIDIQPYLLRVLEERAVYRIGDSKRRAVDVQLVSLTNRDLKKEVELGRFRQDLFYRISAVTIDVPPLRERGHDIVLLVDHFNRQISRETGQAPLHFSQAALDLLLAYPWPGNVRELRNLIERMNLLVRDRRVRSADLPADILDWDIGRDTPVPGALPDPADGGATSLEQAERETIRRAIRMQNGNLTQVARVLGISRPTLYRKMKLYDIRRVYEWTDETPARPRSARSD